VRVAYVTAYDPNDQAQWSGLGNAIMESLRSAGVEVTPIGPLANHLAWIWSVKVRYYRYARRKGYDFGREGLLAWDRALQISARLSKEHFDVVFSPGLPAVSRLRCRQPIVTWADATFASYVRHYEFDRTLASATLRAGNRGESIGLARSALAIYAADWAARSAVDDYGMDPAKVKVVPFGANFRAIPERGTALASIGRRSMGTCRLISIGVEWERKGMDRAVSLAALLNERGLPTELTVVGAHPPPGTKLPPFVHLTGFVSKKTAEGEARMTELLLGAHFHVLFSKAECFGVVFCEANAHAVPNLASDEGGIPTAVRSGYGGERFALSAPLTQVAEHVEHVFREPARYAELARRARDEYDERLNWGAAGRTVRGYLEEILATKRARASA
jgi:glycosyltransferase involved in cell wall biosynthesis